MRFTTLMTCVSIAALPTLARADAPLRFELMNDGSIVVPVWLDGRGPYRFLLDTGSSRSVVSRELAKELRRPVVAKTTVVTVGGTEPGYIVDLGQVRLGELAPLRLRALLNTRERFGVRRIDGIVGLDALSARRFTIDYQRRHVAWNESGDGFGGVSLPLVIEDGRAMVALPGAPGQRALQLVPDTGSSGLVLFGATTALLNARATSAVGQVVTLAGTGAARRLSLGAFRIGPIVLRDVDAVAVDDDRSGLLHDGLMPLHWFARVTFDGPAGTLVVYR